MLVIDKFRPTMNLCPWYLQLILKLIRWYLIKYVYYPYRIQGKDIIEILGSEWYPGKETVKDFQKRL